MPLTKIRWDQEKVKAVIYLVILPLIVIGLAIGISLNWYQQRNHYQEQVRDNQQQIAVLRNALAESCHATTVQVGVISTLILYIQEHGDDKFSRQAIDNLAGYGQDLSNLTACRNITRP